MRNKRFIRKGILLLILSICIFNLETIKSNAYNINGKEKSNKKIILIDPGHGGMDGGAVSKNGTSEKGINLEISKKLRKCLEQKGYKVEMTREEDKGLYSNKGKVRDKKNEDLNNRCKMKVSTKCDLFISIHLNMFTQSKYHGAQVWYSKEGESSKLAHIVQQNLIKDLDKANHRQEKCAKGAYKILRCNDHIPSILVECGFLSNPEEERKLKNNEYQEKIANSIANSIEEFYKSK
ncbi:N-acetylmuramoyl-L-alanine amidase CwlD [Clostridium massiliodielmoense]|uniref:N-acetylmuramoyl-L-alanine amidase CwlD n=1 Tax=Clostridium massiliodielmoense TaxID=1776385 RepID=UPI0001664FD5|nr:N-acetylmuramoyl-L-alanine amidase CwlD [Clostridium massiliodielmoense]EDS76451.1 N-acetylmuramoyl-L-alanine amidase CwlD [Clostridium botulinum C str. Eklund]KEH96616.1 N-acetylmuramoyl-L-alanine amidase [Clostridium botulinum C/D str. BKT12695]NEZ48615.1 N-acetylmuramoyl-L-alanine amidase CwlD [Clostridium botulinum]